MQSFIMTNQIIYFSFLMILPIRGMVPVMVIQLNSILNQDPIKQYKLGCT